MKASIGIGSLAYLLLFNASAEPHSQPPSKVALPAAMQAAVDDFTACVMKDKRAALPLSDDLDRKNICGVYLPYQAAKLKWLKRCLSIAAPVAYETEGLVLGDNKTFMVHLRCARTLPDLSLDLSRTANGFVAYAVHEIVQ